MLDAIPWRPAGLNTWSPSHHELVLDRPVAASSNSVFKGPPNRLCLFGLKLSIIYYILLLLLLLFILVTRRSQFDLYLLSFGLLVLLSALPICLRCLCGQNIFLGLVLQMTWYLHSKILCDYISNSNNNRSKTADLSSTKRNATTINEASNKAASLSDTELPISGRWTVCQTQGHPQTTGSRLTRTFTAPSTSFPTC
jgi:hypothetical protein